MSLKELRKQATSGPRASCPSCGANLPMLELTSGRHAASCPGIKQAVQDAQNSTLQKRLQQEHNQAVAVMKKTTWSERHFDLLGESNFIRQYWAPSVGALMLLSWVVGWTSPQGIGILGEIVSFGVGPLVFLVGIYLLFKGKLSWIHNPFKRRTTSQ